LCHKFLFFWDTQPVDGIQGCSTLISWEAGLAQVLDAATSVPESGILDVVDTVGSEDGAGEGAQPSEDTGMREASSSRELSTKFNRTAKSARCSNFAPTSPA
jgi:hypothetical protein